jgi:hypothetical protein
MRYLPVVLSVSAIVAASLVIETAGFGSSSVDARRADPESLTVTNRALKADRLPLAGDGATRVKTISIRIRPMPGEDRQEVSVALVECESVVSPLADPALSRRARACST